MPEEQEAGTRWQWLKGKFEKLREDCQMRMWKDVVQLRRNFLDETGLHCLECGGPLKPESLNWPVCDCGSKNLRSRLS